MRKACPPTRRSATCAEFDARHPGKIARRPISARRGQSHLLREATGLLERLLDAAEEGRRMASVIDIQMVRALAHAAQDDIESALDALERALTLAEPEGYVQMFVDEGPPMAQLLSAAAARGILPDYVGRLLAAFERQRHMQPEAASANVNAALPVQPLIEPLSPRELEVLHLLAEGLSNREICERLFLALDTVKGHNRRIYAKLEVKRRTEAVARARELGLI
ncbi:MAG: response regulator transcription factor [Caldilineaceae bacterium]|nr:response regulator transcription factor [Caldilineaceae bacterium]